MYVFSYGFAFAKNTMLVATTIDKIGDADDGGWEEGVDDSGSDGSGS